MMSTRGKYYFVLNTTQWQKTLAVAALFIFAGCSQQSIFSTVNRNENAYVITEHTVIPPKPGSSLPQEDDYTLMFGKEVLKVKYRESQTTTAKPGDPIGTGLHLHLFYSDPDVSQVPRLGIPIRRCELGKSFTGGGPTIAVQSTPEHCMAQIGDTLRYEPSPNSGNFTYVAFDILSERVR